VHSGSWSQIRLFGIGPVLRARMMTERRRAHEAERPMDLREFATRAVLGALGAAVAGGGLWWAVTAARDGTLTVGDGRIVEQGPHEVLLDREGHYASLFRLQAAGYQEAK
jgi:hypothetical protein